MTSTREDRVMRLTGGRMFAAAFVAASIAAGTSSARADLVYAADYYPNLFESLELGTLDTQTGIFTARGLLDTDSPIFAMGYGSNGQLYGVSERGELYQINETNAATTALGSVGQTVVGGEAVGGTLILASLDATAILFTAKPPSPTSTTIGPLIDTGTHQGLEADGLVATSPGGTLYVSIVNNSTDDLLYSVDPATGASTFIGNMGVSVFTGLFLGQTLYGFTGDDHVVTIDTSTGAVTPVSSIGIDPLNAICAVAPLSPTSVPEGNSLAMLAIGMAGALFARRRRPS